MLAIADCESVEVGISDLSIRLDSFDTTEDKDALQLNLLSDQVPLYVRQMVEFEPVTLLVGDQTHCSGLDRAGALIRVHYGQLLPFFCLHIDAQHVLQAVSVLVDTSQAEQVLAKKQCCNIASLAQEPVWVAPEVDSLEMARIRVKLDHLRRAEAHLKTSVEAKSTKEEVHLVFIDARAKTEDSFNLRKASLAVLFEHSVLGGSSLVTRAYCSHIRHRLLRDTTE